VIQLGVIDYSPLQVFATADAAFLHAKGLGQRRSQMAFAPPGMLLLARHI